MIDVQLLPLHEYVLVLLLFDTNAMLVPDHLVLLRFRIRDSFWAAADSFECHLGRLRRLFAARHRLGPFFILNPILFLAHRCAPLPSTFLPPENPATDTTLPPLPGPSLA